MRNKKLIGILLALVVLVTAVFGARRIQNRLWDVKLFGYLWADDTVAGQKAWGTTGTADTLVLAGIDSTSHVFIMPRAKTSGLRHSISSNGDTVFVTSDTSLTATTDTYDYFVIH